MKKSKDKKFVKIFLLFFFFVCLLKNLNKFFQPENAKILKIQTKTHKGIHKGMSNKNYDIFFFIKTKFSV
jgi:hypothetical protein